MKKLSTTVLTAFCLLAPAPAFAAPASARSKTPDNYVEVKKDGPTAEQVLGSILYYGAGAAATVFFFQAGGKMSDIRSVSGNSTAEAFYQGVGTLSYGLAAATVMHMAWPLIAPKSEATQQ